MKYFNTAIARQNVIQGFTQFSPIVRLARRLSGAFTLILIMFVAGCGVAPANSNSSPDSNSAAAVITMSPTNVRLGTGGIMNFTASITNGAPGIGVNWSVNGVPGGNTSVGTITPSTQAGARATYKAPANAPIGRSVNIMASYAVAGGGTSAPAVVEVTPNQDATLSGQMAFQFQGFQASGLATLSVGTFTADGSGGLSNILIDTNAVQVTGVSSLFTSKVAWNGSYAMDTVNHGTINLTLAGAPATQMNFSFTYDGVNGSLVETDTPTGSTASGSFNAANPAAFTLATTGFSGPYVMGLVGPGNPDVAFLAQLTFAQVGSSTTSGTVTGSVSDSEQANTTIVPTGTVTMDADGSGHGTMAFSLSSSAFLDISFYVSSSGQIFALQSSSCGEPTIGEIRSQTIPSGGFTAANVFTSNMLFEALGVNLSTGHATAMIGAFSPDPGNPLTQVVGEYDASDGGTVPGGSPVQLTGTFTVDPTVPGKGSLTFTNASTTVITFTFFMSTAGQGYILEETSGLTETRIGRIETQTVPGGGFVNAGLNGITNAVGTLTQTPASVNGVGVFQFGTGSYTATMDSSSVGQSPAIAQSSTGTITFTDSARGRGTVIPGTGSIFGSGNCVFYAIGTSGVALILSVDPTTLEPQIITIGS
jgi:hypothetical protein